MENSKQSEESHLNSIIMDRDDVIKTTAEATVLSQDSGYQKEKIYINANKYKNSLASCMREKGNYNAATL